MKKFYDKTHNEIFRLVIEELLRMYVEKGGDLADLGVGR